MPEIPSKRSLSLLSLDMKLEEQVETNAVGEAGLRSKELVITLRIGGNPDAIDALCNIPGYLDEPGLLLWYMVHQVKESRYAAGT